MSMSVVDRREPCSTSYVLEELCMIGLTRSHRMVVSLVCGLIALFSLAPTAPISAQEQPERRGFTLLLSLGAGLQNDEALDEGSQLGLSGLNLGIGGFLDDRTALWFRVSGTSATYDTLLGDVTQTSGFGGPAIQYWVDERIALEGGVGVGFWDGGGSSDSGLGLMIGGTWAFWTNGGHNLSLGVEYAPAFTDPEMVHNFGFVFGWQLN